MTYESPEVEVASVCVHGGTGVVPRGVDPGWGRSKDRDEGVDGKDVPRWTRDGQRGRRRWWGRDLRSTGTTRVESGTRLSVVGGGGSPLRSF